MSTFTYKPRQFDLGSLSGISDQTLEMHFKLYEGYVRQTNLLNERISEIASSGRAEGDERADYLELKRRLGFEYNGMVLHELYFGNLKKGGGDGGPSSRSDFAKAVKDSFGSFESWKADFASVGAMRGIGWAICYQDPGNGALSNHWIEQHDAGHVAGFSPVVVMDVWEHAYLLDYKPSERPSYIDAFFPNIDWKVVEGRVTRMELASTA